MSRCRPALQQSGFTLIETIIAVFIVGTVLTAVLGAMALGSRVAQRQEESVTLTSLARAQIETIQQAPFAADPAQYPLLTNLPEGVSITVSASDPGTTYTYADGTTLTGTVQEILVAVRGDTSEVRMSFWKVRSP